MRMVSLLEHAVLSVLVQCRTPCADIGEPIDSEPDADVEYEELLPRHGT